MYTCIILNTLLREEGCLSRDAGPKRLGAARNTSDRTAGSSVCSLGNGYDERCNVHWSLKTTIYIYVYRYIYIYIYMFIYLCIYEDET